MKHLHKDNRGIAHLAIILVIVLVVAIGGVGYYVYTKQKSGRTSLSSQAATKLAQKVAQAKCEIDDKDICKFLTSWKENKYYKVESESKQDGKTNKSSYETIMPDKFHMVMTGEYAAETISIGNDLYTKDPADGKWWKQTIKPDDKKKYDKADDYTFSDNSKPDEKPEQKTVYTLIGKEACGKLQCFKYQVINPGANKDDKQFIWFDTKDYQLRRQRDETLTGYNDSTFSYDKVTISAPSPVKELKPDQVIVPGQSEPMTVPNQADVQRLIDEAAAQQSQAAPDYSSDNPDM